LTQANVELKKNPNSLSKVDSHDITDKIRENLRDKRQVISNKITTKHKHIENIARDNNNNNNNQ
jgi:hypothetical protein